MVDPITFRLTPTLDPEERLEEAALWKAVYDETNGTARAVVDSLPATFGRLSKSEYEEPLCYWEDRSISQSSTARI